MLIRVSVNSAPSSAALESLFSMFETSCAWATQVWPLSQGAICPLTERLWSYAVQSNNTCMQAFAGTRFSILHRFHKTKLHLLCKDGNCCDTRVSWVEDMIMQNYFITHGFVISFKWQELKSKVTGLNELPRMNSCETRRDPSVCKGAEGVILLLFAPPPTRPSLSRSKGVKRWATSLPPHTPRLFLPTHHPALFLHRSLSSPIFPFITHTSPVTPLSDWWGHFW